MLIFEMKKAKKISTPVLVEGIDQSHLKFKFIIEHKGVEYGFISERGGDNVSFVIPPLENIIEGLADGVYNARIDVTAITEGDRGFFMQPWAEQIKVKKSVSIEVAPIEEKEEITESVDNKVKLKIASIFTEEEVVEEECTKDKEEKSTKKNNKMRKVFD